MSTPRNLEGRDAQRQGNLVDGEPAEEFQLDQIALPRDQMKPSRRAPDRGVPPGRGKRAAIDGHPVVSAVDVHRSRAREEMAAGSKSFRCDKLVSCGVAMRTKEIGIRPCPRYCRGPGDRLVRLKPNTTCYPLIAMKKKGGGPFHKPSPGRLATDCRLTAVDLRPSTNSPPPPSACGRAEIRCPAS